MMNTKNPKVWRYFDQRKGTHLLETSKLYLRRLDLLTHCYEGDPYEGTPTMSMFAQLKQACRQHLPNVSDADLMKQFDRERRATFVSCWTKSEYESWLMWKIYCKEGGGFAVQTTLKRLWDLHAGLKPIKEYENLHQRFVHYLDHWTDDTLQLEVPIQVFVKPIWFLDEKEIRIALFHPQCAWAGTDEQAEVALAKLKDNELIPIHLLDLVEKIVLNPFSSDEQKNEIVKLVESERPELGPRLRDSDIAKPTVLSRFEVPG